MAAKARRSAPRFVLCLENKGYRASLEVRKVYRTVRDLAASRRGLIRVVGESGEDYLYPKEYFVSIELPRSARRALSNAS